MKQSVLYKLIQLLKQPVISYNKFINFAIAYENNRLEKIIDSQNRFFEEFGNEYKDSYSNVWCELYECVIRIKIECLKSIRIGD